jgi:mono/diheme cytochrome c family protein
MPSYLSPGGVRRVLLVLSAVALVGTALRAAQAPVAPRTSSAQPDASGPQAVMPAGVELFETKVRPLLAANCFACHTQIRDGRPARGLARSLAERWRDRSRPRAGRPGQERAPPGDQHAEGFPRMPRGRAKLPAADIEAVAEWIKAGAVWPGAARRRRPPTSRAKRQSPPSSARSGRSSRWRATRRRRWPMPPGPARTSTASSSRVSRKKGCRPSAPPTS